MASWRHSALLTMVAMSSMPQYDCDPLAEPATRLEHCVERAVGNLKRSGAIVHVDCDLKLPGRFIVVLHPAGELSDEDLMAGGLPSALIPEIRSMRQRRGPAMYVIAADREVTGIGSQRSVQSSRTTSQSTFIEINELMVTTRNTQPLSIDVGRTAGSTTVRRMR